MAQSNSTTTLSGLFKEVQMGEVADLIPAQFKVQNMLKTVTRQAELGNLYHRPAVLAMEHGVTYAASGAGAFTIDAAVAGVLQDAQIGGSQILLRTQVDYESAAKGAKSRNAFKDTFGLLFENMSKSVRKRLEIDLINGGSSTGIGVVSSVSTNDITLTAADFAPGIWSGMEGAKIEAFTSALTTQRTGTMVITAVNLDTRVISVDAAAASLAATDVLFFKTARTTSVHKSMTGIHGVLTNTGTYANISAATYSLWKSTSYSASSAALTQTKVNAAIAQACAKGFEGEGILLCSNKTFGNLLTDQSALVRHVDRSKNKVSYENGSNEIKFFSQNGSDISIVPSIYCKEGFAYGLSKDTWEIGGAQPKPSFETPGQGDQMFLQIADTAGVEMRAYLNAYLFCEAPGKNFVITGIVNS